MNHGGHFHHYHHLEHPASFGGFTANMGSGAGQCSSAKRNNIYYCLLEVERRSVSCKQRSTPGRYSKGREGKPDLREFFQKVQKFQTFHETLQQESDF